MKGSGAPDEILTYGYIKSQDQGFLIDGSPNGPLQDRLGARELYPLGMLMRTLKPSTQVKLEHAAASA